MKEKPDYPPPIFLRSEWSQLQCAFWGLLLGTISFIFTFQPGIILAFLLALNGFGIQWETLFYPDSGLAVKETSFMGIELSSKIEFDSHFDSQSTSLVFEIGKEIVDEHETGNFEIRGKKGRLAYLIKTVSSRKEAINLASGLLGQVGGAFVVLESTDGEEETF